MDSDRPGGPFAAPSEPDAGIGDGGAPPGIGSRLLRLEDARFLRGAGRFVEDIALPGEARAVFLRSPHAHARIRGLSIAEAQAGPGVLAVLTGADVAADGLGGVPWEVRPPTDAPPEAQPPLGDPSVAAPQQPIAEDTARFCGEIVAMVVAGTEAAARDAAERIAVDYEPLPACADSAEAAAPAAPALWPQAPGNRAFTIRLGDPDAAEAAFAQAAHVERIELASNRIFGAPIENRCYIGDYEAKRDRMVLHATAGKPHSTRKTLAADIFGVPPEKIAVKVPDVGGGFGIKNVLYPEACLVLWAARRLGRPVKWIGGRAEGLLSDVGCREQASRAEMAFDGDGRILAVRVRSTGNLGAYLAPRGVVSLRNSGYVLANVYATPAVDYEMRACHSNTAPTCNFRGAGEPEGINVVERLVDAAARRLGRDPVGLRRQNLLPPEALPRTGPAGLARYADRQKFPPQGLFGGRPGAPGAIIRNPGAPDEERMRSKALDTLAEGDVVSLRQPGAGGYGDPRERDLAAIDRDLLDGKVTPEGAERDYDAIVDRAAMRVDREATAALRARTGGAVAAE